MSSFVHKTYTITDLRIGNFRTLIDVFNIERYILRKSARAMDVHVALYRYNHAIADYCENRGGTTRGYNGPCYADYVPFEFDGEDIAASALLAQDVLGVLKGTLGLPIDTIRLFYSGNRSVHLLVPTLCFGEFEPRPDFDRVLFEIVLRTMVEPGFVERMGEYDAWKSSHLDLEMYKPQMMLRFPNTLHEKTMRYKIPISEEMLSDPTRILEEAQSRRPYVPPTVVQTEASLRIGDDLRRAIAAGAELRGKSRTGSFDFKSRMSADRLEGSTPGVSSFVAKQRAYLELWRGGMTDGEWRAGRKGRRQALLSLVGHLKARSIPMDEAAAILALWNESNQPPLDENLFIKTIESSYDGQK